MKKYSFLALCLLPFIFCFYFLPLLIQDTGSAMMILLVVFPILCIMFGSLVAIKQNFQPLFALGVALVFLPTIFFYYNQSAWIYSVVYGLLTLLSNLAAWLSGCLGQWIHKLVSRKK